MVKSSAIVAAIIALVALAVTGVARLDSDLTGMIPAADVPLAREARFFSGMGAIRVLMVEAEVTSPSADPRTTLQSIVTRLAPLGAHPARDNGIEGVAHTMQVVAAHLPEFLTAEDLAETEAGMSAEALSQRLKDLRERLQRPDDWLTATAARQDVLSLTARVLQHFSVGPVGARPDGAFFTMPDGQHMVLRLDVDFPPDDVGRGQPLLAALKQEASIAASHGVHLRWAGSYRHYVENADTIQSDLMATIPLEVLLVGLVIWTLVRSWRAMLVIHLPVVGSVVGAMAGACVWSLVTGRPVPMAMIGATAGILGIAVDYGAHAVVGAQEGRRCVKQLLLGFLTTGAAFICLFFSLVPALQCLGAMVVTGLGTALLSTMLVPGGRIPPPRREPVWNRIGASTNRLLQRQRRSCLLIAAIMTLATLPGLWRLHFESDIKTFDGSTAQAWDDLEVIIQRWGTPDSSTFIVAHGDSPDAALAAAAATRARLGLGPGLLERLVPDLAEQARRREAWNVFWTRHADFPAKFAEACRSNGLRPEAFAPSLAAYHVVTQSRDPITPESWTGSPISAALTPLLHRDGTGWIAASPLPLSGQAALDLMERLPGDSPGWIANRTDLGKRIVSAVQHDLTSLIPMIVAAVVIVMTLAVRAWRPAVAMLLPPALALVWAFGIQGWMGLPLTPFSLLAVTFVLGIGIDSAVFLNAGSWSMSAILVAWLTTLLGTATLLLANHPVVWSLGVSLSIGMTAAFVAALLVTPALSRPAASPAPPA